MRAFWTTAFAIAAMLAASGDASASNSPLWMNMVRMYSTTDTSTSTAMPRDVAAGEMVMISGECVADADDDVRVVLSLADDTDAQAGYHSMLVTDQTREDGTLHVRVPNMPEAKHHVFRVRLFVGADDPRICDAGSIRIG